MPMAARRIWFLVLVGFTGAALLVGCERKGAGSKKAAGAAQVDAGPRVSSLKIKANVDAGVPEGFINTFEAKDKIRDPILFAQKMDQMAREVNPAEAPVYAKKMVEHMQAISTLMRTHIDDCDQVVDALTEYMNKNKAELAKLRKQGDEAQAKLSPEERSKVSTQTLLLMAPFAETLAKTQSRFVYQCTDQAHDVAEQMQNLLGD